MASIDAGGALRHLLSGADCDLLFTDIDLGAGMDGATLAQLVHAGLITQRRLSRQLIYSAEYGAMNDLLAYLTDNCCGRGASCMPACNPTDAFTIGESDEAPARARVC